MAKETTYADAVRTLRSQMVREDKDGSVRASIKERADAIVEDVRKGIEGGMDVKRAFDRSSIRCRDHLPGLNETFAGEDALARINKK